MIRKQETRRSRLIYPLALIGLALGVVVGALAALDHALESNLGPLEGLATTASGALAPEPPIRVVLVEPVPDLGPGPVDSDEESETWRQLLTMPSVALSVVGKNDLPTRPDQADVLVLPWETVLTPEQADQVVSFLEQGGGVLASGRVRVDGKKCAAEAGGENSETPSPCSPDAFLQEYFSVRRQPFEPADDPGDSPKDPVKPGAPPEPPAAFTLTPVADEMLGHVLPAGYTLKLNLEVLRQAGWGFGTQPVAVWSAVEKTAVAGGAVGDGADALTRQSTSTESDQCPKTAPSAVAIGTWKAGRTAWLGFPLSQLYGAHQVTSNLQQMLQRLLRWGAGRPVVDVAPWPGPPIVRVGLAVTVDDREGAKVLSTMLEARGLRPTWFVPHEWQDDEPDIVAALGATGELALRGISGLSSLSLTGQRSLLLEAASMFQPHFQASALGYSPPGGEDSDTLRETLAAVGFDYVLAGRRSDRNEPTWLGKSPHPLLVLSPPVLQLETPDLLEQDIGVPVLERFKRVKPDPAAGAWTIIRLASHSFRDRRCREQAEALFETIADRKQFDVAPLGEMVRVWQAHSSLSFVCRKLRDNRYHVRVNGADVRLDAVRAQLFLPSPSRPVGVDSHHLESAGLSLTLVRPGVFQLEFDQLEAGRIQDFFIGTEQTNVAQLPFGGRRLSGYH